MRQCPKCERPTKESERIEKDDKSKKNWLITFCAHCGFNHELEEYKDKVLSPEEEMDKYEWPQTRRPWPHA